VNAAVDGHYGSMRSLGSVGRIDSLARKSGGRNKTIVRLRGDRKLNLKPGDDEERIVTINVGGRVYMTCIRTLLKLPGTLLYEMAQEGGELYTDSAVFIDRDNRCFDYILQYYRSGELDMPPAATFSEKLWTDELKFWKIDDPAMKLPTASEVDALQRELGKPATNGLRRKLWLLWEDPQSSTMAKFLLGLSVFLSVGAVCTFVLETQPSIRTLEVGYHFLGLSAVQIQDALAMFEMVVIVFFSIELVTRFIATSKKLTFLRTPLNWMDALTVLPFYLNYMLDPSNNNNNGTVVDILRLARLSRILGLALKLGKYSTGVRVLGRTMKTCISELGVLGVLLIMAVIIISSAIYYCESTYDIYYNGGDEAPSKFESISRSMYFSMISVTTIGYGDLTPRTSCGEFVACLAGLSGIFVLGLPISIIGVKFEERYSEMTNQLKVQRERERLLGLQKKLQALKGMSVVVTKILGRRPSDPRNLTIADREMIQQKAVSVFHEVDLDNSGEIDIQELGAAMKKLGMDLDSDVLAVMMQVIDTDGSNSIDATEFTEFVFNFSTGEIWDQSENIVIGQRTEFTQ